MCWSLSLGTSLHRATSVARTDLQAAVAPMRELAGPGSSGSVLLLSSLASRNSRGGNDGGDARRIGPQCIASRSFWAGSLARHATRHAAFNCSRYRVITPGLVPLGPVPKVRSRSSLFTDTRPRRRTGSSARLGRRVERPPLFRGQGCATQFTLRCCGRFTDQIPRKIAGPFGERVANRCQIVGHCVSVSQKGISSSSAARMVRDACSSPSDC